METRAPDSTSGQSAHPAKRASIIEAAHLLAPTLRGRADETARLRRLPDSTFRDLIDTGMLRSLQPSHWGGREDRLDDFITAVAEIARAEGSTGWVLGVLGVHPWQTALFPRETQEEVWGADATVFNSSSYAPTGKAERVSGGYRVYGRWSFSTGCDHCQWVNLGGITEMIKVEGREVPDFRSFLIPRKDYRIDDNWHVAGLSGTGSKDIVVDNAFVPDHRSQSHWDYMRGAPLPGWELNPSPLYRLPWAVVFNYSLAATIIGAARGFLDLWLEASRTRKAGLGAEIKDDPFTQKLAAEAVYTIDGGIGRLRHDAAAMMAAAEAGEPLDRKWRAQLRYNACRSAQLAAQAVDRMYESSSGRIIFTNHPMQRPYQDIKAMLGHTYLNVDTPARFFGAMEFGVPILEALL
jgi:3-hydroxy-9,10-secoandrosta-1,3,5(10)-triene-9,17-dione monooxygenase